MTGRAAARRLDWPLLLAAGALVVVGGVLVWSATAPREPGATGPGAYLHRHLVSAALGIVLAVAAARVDVRLLRAYAPLAYLAAVVGLLAVLSPLGATVNGSRSWLSLGGLTLQPSEPAKVALVVVVAALLAARRSERDEGPPGGAVVVALLLAALPVGLVLLQPDLGTVLVMTVTVFGALVASGASAGWLAGLVVTGAAGAVAVVQTGLLTAYQVARLAAFADPTLDPQGVGYATAQARAAIGAGGLAGRGVGQGALTGGGFVPEQQTDFVLTVAGEELGFLGTGALLLLLGVVLWRACRIALGARDAFGATLSAGIASWFAVQAFENAGMALGIMPVTGVPLPLVSYGGSAMLANLLAIGLLQAVARSGRA